MKTIDKNELKERLIDCGYIPQFGLDNTIENLLNLKNLENPNAYKMLEEWMETNKIQKFEPIEGIDLKYLRDILKMKDPAIILAYGMLLHDPKRNAIFLKKEQNRKQKYSLKLKRPD